MSQGFQKQVLEIVARIPRGRVVTYGQIAMALGVPQGAQRVGWAMHACPEGSPWFRVVNRFGKSSLSPDGAALQLALLAEEGVLADEEGRINLTTYQWDIK